MSQNPASECPNCTRTIPAAALRDAGWVDPEEAARLRGERDEARGYVDTAVQSAVRIAAERDALLPVVEAARAWRAQRPREGAVTATPTAAALTAAVDALDQKAPETALRATQTGEELAGGTDG